ncbi:MAG TPA: CHAT domain-containing protein [Thermoanaerobaculia bacterium]|nr:CHAT domain-containing protein [Thermoanaerobaculia bacterium]
MTKASGAGDADLAQGVSYWLRAGKQLESRLRTRFDSFDEVMKLKFESHYNFDEIGAKAWTNIALARAASGDLRGGAEMMEAGSFLFMFANDIAHIRADAAALSLEQLEGHDDVRKLLDTLASLRLVIPIGRHQTTAPSVEAEARFNRGLVLEKLGLYGPARESYQLSMQKSDDGWSAEARRRMDYIAEPSRRSWWSTVRPQLAARSNNSDALRDIVTLFPDYVRDCAEKELLGDWAGAVLAGRTADAEQQLALVRRIAAALRNWSADSFLDDVVAKIDEAIRRHDAHQIEELARAHALYASADSAGGYDEAAEAFEHAGSPMNHLARWSAIMTRFDAVPINDSLAQLRQLEREVPIRHRGLRASVDGAIGQCLAQRGDFSSALDAYLRAQHSFEAFGEIESAARMRVFAAHMLTLMGQPVAAWRVRKPALRYADASGDPALVELVQATTASDELFNREEPRALALYESVLPLPPMYAPTVSGLTPAPWRNPAPLLSKEVMLDAVAGRPLRADVQNDVRLAQAISLCRRKPEQAEALLTQCIDYAKSTGRTAMLPYVYFYRAMARREAKREDDAIADLSSAISLLEVRRRNTARPDLRDLWYRVADDPFHELMDLYWQRHDDSAAFRLGERRRGLVFLDGVTNATAPVEPLPAEAIAERIDAGTAIVVFTSSPQFTLATLIEKGHVEMHRLAVPTGRLLQAKTKLRTAIDHDRLTEIDRTAEELYELLIAPLNIDPNCIKRLVVVADQPLHDVSFAVFRNRQTRRYLIEDFELLRVASASVYAQTKKAEPAQLRSVVTIGDPAFDRVAHPSLPALPGARAESVSVAREYPQAKTLIGRDATFSNLVASISTADVVHFATHTAPSSEEQQVRDLLLTPSSEHGGACSLGDAAALPLRKGSIVVTAACRTGTSREPGTLRDFAGSFLAAGARNVVATLWDVEDISSMTFSRAFHRSLRASGSAVAATREAQLAMLRSTDIRLRLPRAWSGFQVYGVGP